MLKKKKNLIIISLFVFIAAALIILVQFVSDTNYHINEDTSLIDPFKSLMKPQEVEVLLKEKGLTLTVIEEHNLKENDPRPPFQVLSWKIENYEHNGYKGVAVLDFFNFQLKSTRFYPRDASGYIKSINKKLETVLQLNAPYNFPPKSEVIYNKDSEGKLYIIWTDKELQNIVDKWIKTYS